MPKALTIIGLVVAGLVVVLFALDLAIQFPFQRASLMLDIAFLISGSILGYLGWSTLRDLD